MTASHGLSCDVSVGWACCWKEKNLPPAGVLSSQVLWSVIDFLLLRSAVEILFGVVDLMWWGVIALSTDLPSSSFR